MALPLDMPTHPFYQNPTNPKIFNPRPRPGLSRHSWEMESDGEEIQKEFGDPSFRRCTVAVFYTGEKQVLWTGHRIRVFGLRRMD